MDIVERLRQAAKLDSFYNARHLKLEAAVQIKQLREGLAWALDIIAINDARIRTLDPEGWAELNQRADVGAKLKAFATLIGNGDMHGKAPEDKN